MRFHHLSATRFVTLFGLAALLAGTSAGCQCCAWTERFMDCVDHVSDHEGRAEVLYHPGWDLTRIGRADWPWRWCRRCRTSPGFVYETPVTDRVMARMHAQEFGPDEVPPAPAPPPLLPDDLWSEPTSPYESDDDDIGVIPLGPMFEQESSAPAWESRDAPVQDTEATDVAPLDTAPPAPLPPTSESPEIRTLEPAPDVSRPRALRDNDRPSAHNADPMTGSGVVRLFDDAEMGGSSPVVTVHAVDQDDFGPISMESWLSDRPLGESDVETASRSVEHQPSTPETAPQVPAWAASAHAAEEADAVLPVSATHSVGEAPETKRAEWWESDPREPSSLTPSESASSTSDDVFGPVPFAEWQSVAE